MLAIRNPRNILSRDHTPGWQMGMGWASVEKTHLSRGTTSSLKVSHMYLRATIAVAAEGEILERQCSAGFGRFSEGT